ncbi:hypothetical protein CMK12_06470 [Candidatus Poribacteria bacterium]|nr:hypothetical protein [Candidatus Poribacteria bacterium]
MVGKRYPWGNRRYIRLT